MRDAELVIDVKNLSKKFDGKPVVIDVSLQVKRGEIFGFLGPNGTGKTTTIRMLCGLLTPDSGSGKCLGYDIRTDARAIRAHVGYMSQYFGLYRDLTVHENLEFIAELYGLTQKKEQIERCLEQLDLTNKKNQLAGSLSGGWKQRLSLAAALLHDPYLLLLDEPTASVDPKSRRSFWELMHNLSATGVTILLSSHNMEEVERCHRIAYMCNGQILMAGTIIDIIQQVGLTTWLVKGENLTLLARQLQETPHIDQVMTFHNALHISSKDNEKLATAIKPYLEHSQFQWTPIESTLEDVFVWLTKKD